MLDLVVANATIPTLKGCNVEVFKFLNIKVFASHVVIFKIENNRVVPVYTFRIIGGRPSSESWVTDIPNNHYVTRGKLAKERLKGVDLSGNPIQKFAKFIKAMDNSGDRIRIEFQNNKLLIYTSSHDFIKNYLEVFTELTERSKQVYVLTKYKKKKYLISFEGTESFGVYEYEIRSIKNGMLLTK